jgi:hypothetical protein
VVNFLHPLIQTLDSEKLFSPRQRPTLPGGRDELNNLRLGFGMQTCFYPHHLSLCVLSDLLLNLLSSRCMILRQSAIFSASALFLTSAEISRGSM